MGAAEVERARESLLVAPAGQGSAACCECSPSAGGIRENGEVCRARPMMSMSLTASREMPQVPEALIATGLSIAGRSETSMVGRTSLANGYGRLMVFAT